MLDNEQPEAQAQQSATAEELSAGAVLRSAREAQQLTLEEVAGELRIARHHLEALEGDRFDELGPPVFAKGYLKQYARRLGLEAEPLVARYQQRGEDKDIFTSPSRPIRMRDDAQIGIWVGAIVALALVVAAIAVWWWSGSPVPASDLLSTPAIATPEPEPEPAPRPEAPGPELGREPASVSAAPAGRGPIVAEPPPVPRARAAAPMNGESAAGTTTPRTVVGAEGADAASAIASGPRMTVRLRFSDDCWTEVTDAEEHQLYYGLGRAGAEVALSGVAPLSFFFGNADGATIEIDGRPYAIPAPARRGNLANFTVAAPER